MTYALTFDSKVIYFLNKLPENDKKRIFKKITSTKSNSLRFFERLARRKDCKLRVGDYRIIADIDLREKKIVITKAGHRKNVYKNL